MHKKTDKTHKNKSNARQTERKREKRNRVHTQTNITLHKNIHIRTLQKNLKGTNDYDLRRYL